MIHLIAIILIQTVSTSPVDNSSTTAPHFNTNTPKVEGLQNPENSTIFKNNSAITISRSDNLQDVITPAEVAIAFVKTNGTTFGDNFSNPYGTKLDLPKHKKVEETIKQNEASNLEKPQNQYGQLKVSKEKNFNPSMEEDNPETFKPISPFFEENDKDYYEDNPKAEKLQYPSPSYEEVIQKHIYVHVPPEESEEVTQSYNKPIKKEKHYKIVFIKAPTQKVPQVTQMTVQKEEKTLIYVLVKKPDLQKIFGPTTVSPVETTLPSKPEVYYISYKPNFDRTQNKGYLPMERKVDEDFYENDRKDDLDDVEVKSNLDDVTV